MGQSKIEVPKERIGEFCRRWRVAEFALFGSVLSDDFGRESDVDVLVTFDSGAHPSLLDLVQMEEELEGIFGRRVEVIEKEGIRNPFRRHAILNNMEVVYEI